VTGRYRVFSVEIPPSAGGGLMVVIADEDVVERELGGGESGSILPRHLAEADTVDEASAAQYALAGDVVLFYGERSVSLALALGLAEPGTEARIRGVPHLQVFKFRVG